MMSVEGAPNNFKRLEIGAWHQLTHQPWSMIAFS
jgi:hypothetical protein